MAKKYSDPEEIQSILKELSDEEKDAGEGNNFESSDDSEVDAIEKEEINSSSSDCEFEQDANVIEEEVDVTIRKAEGSEKKRKTLRKKRVKQIQKKRHEGDNEGGVDEYNISELGDLYDSDIDPEYIPEFVQRENADDKCTLEQGYRVKTNSKGRKKSKSEVPMDTDENLVIVSQVTTLCGKLDKQNNAYKWYTKPVVPEGGKVPKHNIVHITPGPTAEAKNAFDPLDSFLLFCSEDIIEIIKHHTNDEIRRNRAKYDQKG